MNYKNDSQHERNLASTLKAIKIYVQINFDGYLNASKDRLNRSYPESNHFHKKTAHKV